MVQYILLVENFFLLTYDGILDTRRRRINWYFKRMPPRPRISDRTLTRLYIITWIMIMRERVARFIEFPYLCCCIVTMIYLFLWFFQPNVCISIHLALTLITPTTVATITPSKCALSYCAQRQMRTAVVYWIFVIYDHCDSKSFLSFYLFI